MILLKLKRDIWINHQLRPDDPDSKDVQDSNSEDIEVEILRSDADRHPESGYDSRLSDATSVLQEGANYEKSANHLGTEPPDLHN
ncbi:unnamed protein product [Allacma fusca]|uniref:Uncharacterized protein n=1 Tax=Allacma fusca TaxID=39272 RepID=A0A8J2NZR3_9HEXA|nr:unnamed protein product [Allacma fusca]